MQRLHIQNTACNANLCQSAKTTGLQLHYLIVWRLFCDVTCHVRLGWYRQYLPRTRRVVEKLALITKVTEAVLLKVTTWFARFKLVLRGRPFGPYRTALVQKFALVTKTAHAGPWKVSARFTRAIAVVVERAIVTLCNTYTIESKKSGKNTRYKQYMKNKRVARDDTDNVIYTLKLTLNLFFFIIRDG